MNRRKLTIYERKRKQIIEQHARERYARSLSETAAFVNVSSDKLLHFNDLLSPVVERNLFLMQRKFSHLRANLLLTGVNSAYSLFSRSFPPFSQPKGGEALGRFTWFKEL